ncbi:hypothetical protein B0T24DRAFT_598688 [Lasiosphaeria ovina]|uniref:Ubiquinol-cytochrome-c reductase complex assembly factor 2 n=1 Tax=Lasiosphaeria ovina TaxID=92902 RepID=A0AAE0JUN5_9PEZI|nr:hypothetical protein B0T24DRAFT_598688 [Lasiosphaeria ovina]
MSGAVRSAMFKRALERWPKNPLRPDCQLQDVLAKRLEAGTLAPPHALKNGVSKAEAEMKQANAFYSLLENRYKSIYKLKGDIMNPHSNPTYYQDLITELDEAPTRSWLDRTLNKFKGMIRFTS